MLQVPNQQIRYYNFDLDMDKNDRWKHIFDSFSNESLNSLRNFGKTILQKVPDINTLNSMFNVYPKSGIMFLEELEYISKRMNMSLIEIILLQLVYEGSAACTTGIFTNGTNQYFFRTLDWNATFLKKYTIGLNIYRKGKHISTAITWLGIVGFFTATSLDNKYSVAVNYRRTENASIFKNILRTVTGYYPVSYLLRSVANSEDVISAIDTLKTTELISPCYFIVCDWNNYTDKNSCVITRDCDKLVDIRYKNLIQTNHDLINGRISIKYNILHSFERNELFDNIIKNGNVEISDFLKFPIINSETIYLHYMCNMKELSTII
jgi:hypothetical protein